MTFNSIYGMPNANNMTVTTKLSSCDNSSLDIDQTIYDLRNLYQNNLTLNLFFNISINNFNCTNGIENYFQQIIIFTHSISIRTQVLFASIYFDYIYANHYHLNGFIINSETAFNLSSITTNNSDTSNACSSAEKAQDSLCLSNITNSVCTILSNPWNFTCSELTTTHSLSEYSKSSETTAMPSRLNSWQLGLICGFSVLFVLIIISISAFFYRRYRHSKNLALSRVNLYDDVTLMKKISGIPQGQAFQRATAIIQPKLTTYTATSWIHDGVAMNNMRKDESFISIKPPGPYNQVSFVDHAKIHDPNLPSTYPMDRIGSGTIPRPLSGTSINRSISASPKKPSTPLFTQFSNFSFIDDNLTDEDAWMSILDVVNAELAKLNEQDRIRTYM